MAVVRLETEDHQENGFVSPEPAFARQLPQIDASVLPFLGGFGKYQKQFVLLTWIPALFIGFSQFSDYFLLAQPNSTCVHPTVNQGNWTGSSLWINATNGSTPAPSFHSHGTQGETNATLCMCKEWHFELQTGLKENVVTKVRSAGGYLYIYIVITPM